MRSSMDGVFLRDRDEETLATEYCSSILRMRSSRSLFSCSFVTAIIASRLT